MQPSRFSLPQAALNMLVLGILSLRPAPVMTPAGDKQLTVGKDRSRRPGVAVRLIL